MTILRKKLMLSLFC